MCGIIGIVSQQPVVSRIVAGLKRLEYRGYDSTGVAALDPQAQIAVRRSVGKIHQLQSVLEQNPMEGNVGMGHTRWATHGAPAEHNAHPVSNGRVAVVHNGIIENFKELRCALEAKGYVFTSETDTETVVHLIASFLDQGLSPKESVSRCLKELKGAFALVIMFQNMPDHLFGARRGSPLVVGYGDQEMFLGSDALGLAPLTDRIAYLEEGDWVCLHQGKAEIFSSEDLEVQRAVVVIPSNNFLVAKDAYPHFMLKEIHEQPTVVGDTLLSFLTTGREPCLDHLSLPSPEGQSIQIVACGTSYYAAMIAKYWIESLARVPVNVDVASEFRYRTPPLNKGIAVFVSQSGETADTLAALSYAKEQGLYCLAIVNVVTSSMARAADGVLVTDAGPEIGVASTKAFLAQLTVLLCLALGLRKKVLGTSGDALTQEVLEALTHLPALIQQVLEQKDLLRHVAVRLSQARDILYLGRGPFFPLALEGALKLKELSYIHAEGFAAGEMKHGPIALIDPQVPVVVVAPTDPLFDKTLSNTHEVLVRGAPVFFFSDEEGCQRAETKGLEAIVLPKAHPFVAPLLYAVPLQLLAYEVAVLKGTDVDQPRNLAKSVTVE